MSRPIQASTDSLTSLDFQAQGASTLGSDTEITLGLRHGHPLTLLLVDVLVRFQCSQKSYHFLVFQLLFIIIPIPIILVKVAFRAP